MLRTLAILALGVALVMAAGGDAVDLLRAFDQGLDWLAAFVEVGSDGTVTLGESLLHYDGGQRVAMLDEWVVVDGDEIAIGGWTLPPLGGPPAE